MLANIVDRRSNEHAAGRLNVVAEPSWHDNSIEGADRHPVDHALPSVEERYGLSLAEAVAWAESFPGPMTLFLYDADHDPMGAAPDLDPEMRPALRRAADDLARAAEALEPLPDRRLRDLLGRLRRRVGWLADNLGERADP